MFGRVHERAGGRIVDAMDKVSLTRAVVIA